MKLKQLIQKIRARVSAAEALLWLSFLQAMIVAMPFVVRQFYRLQDGEGAVKTGDVVWNMAFDFLIFNLALLVFILLVKLLRKGERWLDRKN